MSLGAELKRRLDVVDQPLSKRLRLAENVLSSPFFPALNREEIILNWICSHLDIIKEEQERLDCLASLKSCLSRSINYKNFTTAFKIKLIQVLSQLINSQNDYSNNQKGTANEENILILESCLSVIKNQTISSHFQHFLDEYFSFLKLILQNILHNCQREGESTKDFNLDTYEAFAKQALTDLSNFTKTFGKKQVLVESFVDSGMLRIVLEFTYSPKFSYKALNVCQSILFPLSSLQIYRSYLSVLIKGMSILTLIEERGESLRTVVKVLDILLKYTTDSNKQYLLNFIKLFLYCSKKDESLIFLFNIVLTRCLGINQEYIQTQGTIPMINLDENFVKQVYLQNIKYLAEYNVNLNITYSDVANDASKSESKRNFVAFLQSVTLNLLLTDSSLNASSLLIIKSVIALDPAIFEPNISKILPAIMVQKKINPEGCDIIMLYSSVMKTILEIQFKLSRGLDFLPKLLPSLKLKLESIDDEQRKIILKERKLLEAGSDAAKLTKKIVTVEDVFPEDICNGFGKLGSELMSWQNIDLFNMLSKQLDSYCILHLTSEDVAPSAVTLGELLCSCLCAFLQHIKVADQAIPQTVVKKFTDAYKMFGKEILAKFGGAVLKFPGEKRIFYSFLRVCHSFGQLKLLLSRYQSHYIDKSLPIEQPKGNTGSKVMDLSSLHPYLSASEWKTIGKLVKKMDNPKCTEVLNQLILQKITALDVNSPESMEEVKMYTIDNLKEIWPSLVLSNFNCNIVFSNLTETEIKLAAKKIVTVILNDENKSKDDESLYSILKKESIANNKNLLSMILLECARDLWLIFDREKMLKKYKSIFEASEISGFDIKIFLNTEITDINEYMADISNCKFIKKSSTIEKVIQIIDLMNALPIEYLKENFQFVAIFIVVVIKNSIKKNLRDDLKVIFDDIELKCDTILLKIFELSYKSPNIVDLFPPKFIFQNDILELVNSDGNKNIFAFKVLKHIFERFITKDCVKDLKKIIKYLIETNQNENNDLKLKNNSFQISSALFITLVNFKKANLSSEIKTPLLKSLNKIKEFICGIFEAMKWKSVFKNDSKIEIETGDVVPSVNLNKSLANEMQLSKLHSIIETDLKLVLLNIVESFAIVIRGHCEANQDDDVKKLKCLGKALTLFTNVSLAALSNSSVSLHHARGAAHFINTILKNQKHFEKNPLFLDSNSLHTQIWNATILFLQNNTNKNGASWSDISNTNIENVKLIFEVSEQKFFSQFLTKQLMSFSSLASEDTSKVQPVDSHRPIHITKLLWTCFLNANLKAGGKNDTRSNLVKQMCCSFYFWLRQSNSFTVSSGEDARVLENRMEDEEEIVEGKGKTVSKENLEIFSAYFEIMAEFVSTKKMILSSSLIDIVLQLPVIVTFDVDTCQTYGDAAALAVFSTTFGKCMTLVNALLIHRSELLQDRWPCFLQAYRKLMKCLCSRSHTDKVTDLQEIETLVKMALSLERLTQSMVKNEKHDLSRIASYLIADIVANFQRIPVSPRVKFHLQNCVYCLLQLLDSHAVGFLMRNLPSRIVFQQIYNTYNTYYKYTGS